MAGGAAWAARVPPHWNGTLLIYSHGYSAALRAPDLAPRGTQDWLLDHGYALAASAYSAPGWAVAEAVPEQIAGLDAFEQRFGHPQRVIAWGGSMGGLVTIALAEQFPDRIDAALPSCGSLAGSIGMMNQALDGAFVVKQLLAPGTGIQLVNIEDDQANGARVQAAVEQAWQSAGGRARLSLAAALAQVPQPGADGARDAAKIAHDFTAGVFLPRRDQERRAGGVFSWNTGIDYRQQLARSGQAPQVRAVYRAAALSLDADLRALGSAPRISAAPAAVSYMRLHYVPSGDIRVPVFSYHTIGDELTTPTQQMSYAAAVRAAGHLANLGLGWVARAGHCNFTAGEHVAALELMDSRLRDGRWNTSPDRLNMLADQSGLGAGRFVALHPVNFLRFCGRVPCAGETPHAAVPGSPLVQ